MFKSARLKLTAWYIFIIMAISSLFSVVIYGILTDELDRVERMQMMRFERQNPSDPVNIFQPPRRAMRIDPDIISETKDRIRNNLIVINFGILIFAGGAAFFLAGRTLKPIEEMVKEQKRFIADASHELRTPLTALKSEIEVSLRDRKLSLKEAKELLSSNLEEVDSLQLLTDRLIDLAQYQGVQQDFKFQSIDIQQVVQEAVKKVQPLAKKKEIIIDTNIRSINIEADFDKFVELLVILLDNSIKYSPNKTRINVTAEKIESQLKISVSDQGEGIEQKDIPYIFNRFYRGDRSRTKDGVAGYGLGLAIAKRIIDTHHGSVKVLSKLGKGAEFNIYFPIKQSKVSLSGQS